jgi:hypothetical protein
MNSLAEEIRGWLRADARNRSPADHERVIRQKAKPGALRRRASGELRQLFQF